MANTPLCDSPIHLSSVPLCGASFADPPPGRRDPLQAVQAGHAARRPQAVLPPHPGDIFATGVRLGHWGHGVQCDRHPGNALCHGRVRQVSDKCTGCRIGKGSAFAKMIVRENRYVIKSSQ